MSGLALAMLWLIAGCVAAAIMEDDATYLLGALPAAVILATEGVRDE